MDTIKKLAKNKKFMTGITSVILVVANEILGWPLSETQLYAIFGLVAPLIGLGAINVRDQKRREREL